jgi:hypothetical protein
MMHPDHPLTGNPATLRRLTSLYMVVFWCAIAFFYITFFSSGYESRLAVLSATCGAIAFWLLRFQHRAGNTDASALQAEVWPKPWTRNSLLSLEALLDTTDDVLRQAARSGKEVGLALITVRGPEKSRSDPLAVTFLQELLYREAHSRVFRAEEDTLAVIESQANLAQRLDQLAVKLHWQFRGRQLAAAGLDGHHLVIGVAIADRGKGSATAMLDNAVAAIKRAEMLKKDTFFRQV